MSNDQVTSALEAGSPGSAKSKRAIEALKREFPELTDKIDKVAKAYNAYFPFRGRLDDPSDLQRMLRGAGILEFRILPTLDHPEVDSAQVKAYEDTLKTKGPKYPLDDQYVWLEIENPAEVARRRQGQAGRPSPHSSATKPMSSPATEKIKTRLCSTRARRTGNSSNPPPVRTSREDEPSISSSMNAAENSSLTVTGKNLDRPLCIVLDSVAHLRA